jgi:acetyltransferase-like isoleucine patch superfamily enzyme
MKKFIPHFIKKLFWQCYLKTKYRKDNVFGKRVTLSKDSILGKGCKIGDYVILGQKVKIGDNVTIGSGAYIERLEIGENSVFEGRAIITGYGDGIIKIGKESFVGHNTVLDFSDNITIGNYVHIGYSHFWTHSSIQQCFNGISLNEKNKVIRPIAPIVIEDFVYVGVQSTIYPGITIGHHSIIMPHSCVTKNVLPYTMVAGIPAKMIKNLLSKD